LGPLQLKENIRQKSQDQFKGGGEGREREEGAAVTKGLTGSGVGKKANTSCERIQSGCQKGENQEAKKETTEHKWG